MSDTGVEAVPAEVATEVAEMPPVDSGEEVEEGMDDEGPVPAELQVSLGLSDDDYFPLPASSANNNTSGVIDRGAGPRSPVVAATTASHSPEALRPITPLDSNHTSKENTISSNESAPDNQCGIEDDELTLYDPDDAERDQMLEDAEDLEYAVEQQQQQQQQQQHNGSSSTSASEGNDNTNILYGASDEHSNSIASRKRSRSSSQGGKEGKDSMNKPRRMIIWEDLASSHQDSKDNNRNHSRYSGAQVSRPMFTPLRFVVPLLTAVRELAAVSNTSQTQAQNLSQGFQRHQIAAVEQTPVVEISSLPLRDGGVCTRVTFVRPAPRFTDSLRFLEKEQKVLVPKWRHCRETEVNDEKAEDIKERVLSSTGDTVTPFRLRHPNRPPLAETEPPSLLPSHRPKYHRVSIGTVDHRHSDGGYCAYLTNCPGVELPSAVPLHVLIL